MEVQVHHSDKKEGVAIVVIDGRIDAHTAPDVEKALHSLQEQQIAKIIVDFEEVNYISSGGLRVFLTALKWTRANGGDVKLARLTSNVEKIFRLAGFTKIFNITTGIDEALEGF